jgi:hypothetical protein
MMEMLITRISSFPPVLPLMEPDSQMTADDVHARELLLQRKEKETILGLETAIERAAVRQHTLTTMGIEVLHFIPFILFILLFAPTLADAPLPLLPQPSEAELAAIHVDEGTSHLLSQLALFDPSGPARRPPPIVFSNLQV